MKIALYHNLPSGGAKRAIFEWTKRLAERHVVDVYTLSTADHDFCDIRPFVHKHYIYDFNVHREFSSPLGRLNQVQRWRDLGHLASVNQQIAREMDEQSYDVLFANTCQFTVMPTVLSFSQTPGLYYLHEPFGRRFQRNIQRPYDRPNHLRELVNTVDPLIKIYRHRLDLLQKGALNRVKFLLANSDFTRKQMWLEHAVDTPVCSYGVNLQGFRMLPNEQKEDYLISVGELSPRKGFDFLIESLAYIPQKERPKLHIACNTVIPEEKKYIQALAAERGVSLDISTNLNMEQLTVLYNRARVCVYAPLQEPFGLAPIEAMACGLPVIGVREGGVQESIIHGETGLLVERDPELFAEAIHQLWFAPELVQAYGRRAREHVCENWTWEKSVSRLEHYLVECAVAKGARFV